MVMVNGNQSSNSNNHHHHSDKDHTLTGSLSSAISSTKAYFNPFNHSSNGSHQPQSSTSINPSGQQSESARLLTDVAPHLMHPRMLQSMNSVVTRGSSSSIILGNNSHGSTSQRRLAGGYNTFNLSISHPARSLGRISNAIKSGPITSNELRVLEISDEILAQATLLPEDDDEDGPSSNIAKDVSLFRGFQATLPSNLEGRNRRRKQRGREVPKMGLRAMGDNARGLLTEGSGGETSDSGGIFQSKEMRKARRSLVAGKKDEIPLGIDELQNQVDEISVEKENLNIRRVSSHEDSVIVDVSEGRGVS